MIVEGRSDDQTWTGIPLKTICKAATRACVVLCSAIPLLNALSIFSPQFFPNSAFITLCGFPPTMLCCLLLYHFIACSVFNPVKKSEWSRWCASHVGKVWSITPWSSSLSQHRHMQKRRKPTHQTMTWDAKERGQVCVVLTFSPFQTQATFPCSASFYSWICRLLASHTHLLLCVCIAHFGSQPQANPPNTWKIKICEQA